MAADHAAAPSGDPRRLPFAATAVAVILLAVDYLGLAAVCYCGWRFYKDRR